MLFIWSTWHGWQSTLVRVIVPRTRLLLDSCATELDVISTL